MESFFGTLKSECLHHPRFKTRTEAKQVAFEYIEVFYNRIRRYAKINYQILHNSLNLYLNSKSKMQHNHHTCPSVKSDLTHKTCIWF